MNQPLGKNKISQTKRSSKKVIPSKKNVPIKLTKQQISERQNRGVELRKAGMSYRQIAKVLDISETTVRKDVQKMFAHINDEHEITRHHLEIERLEMAMTAIAKEVRSGDPRAIDRWIKLCDLRHKLLCESNKDIHTESLTIKVVADVDLEQL